MKSCTSFLRLIAITALILTLGVGHAMAQRALGIDVSRFQNTINWTSVKGAGYTFAWAQATRGAYLTNVNFAANMINGKAAGVLMGAYHYAFPATNSASVEANYFWNLAGPHIKADGKTFVIMLDIEHFDGHVGATSYSDWATQWYNIVVNKAATAGVNIKFVLYSSASFMCNFDSSLTILGSDVANYNGQNPQTGTPWSCCSSCNFWGGSAWDFWQYTSSGSVPGISGNVDLDVFNGTAAELSPWVATAVGPPVISGVAAGNLSSTGATITWDTDINSDSVVNYGLTTSYGTTRSNSTMVVNHSINLTGLTASTLYHYRVKSRNSAGQLSTSGDFTFTTLATGQVGDIIIDNPAATVVGSWSTGTISTDKFGTDYRYKSQGTGSSNLKYIPNILTAGDYNVYCWYPEGANRATDTPYVIAYNGGTATVPVNQQSGGGTWNLLGTFNFVTGTAGSVKVTDAIGSSSLVAVADAVKFSYALVSPPAAPSGLTATAVSSSQINLAWMDNSNNEDNFIVSRSTTSGGPYTDIATLAANTTSYNNTGRAAGTTYYYVVRAVNTGGSSALSAQASATTFSSSPPAAPSGLTATAAGSTSINLSWTDNSNNELNFIVGRSSTSGGPYTDIVTLGANVTSYGNTGLSPNTTYYYVVRASNGSGSSVNSAQASATTQPVADIVIDNASATFVGTWSTGTASTDKFGADYRYHTSGTGSSKATYSPNILAAGNYEVFAWYPQGANRPTNAPYVIHFNGGSTSLTVNQQINGGVWNSLGIYNFATGSTGNAQVTDNFSGTPVVMADAIKFVYVP